MDAGQGLQGAAGGAAVGTAILPGWGTAIGAGVGGLMGLFGGSSDPNAGIKAETMKKLQALADSVSGRAAPQIGNGAVSQIGYGQQSANQQALISQLQSMAMGQGPSAAAMQMREAMDRASAAQASGAAGAGGRGVNQGAAYLNAANNTAAIQAQGARDTATLRAQEQLNAIGQLGQNINAARQADTQVAQFNSGALNQAGLANLQAQLQTLGLNDETQLKALMGSIGVAPSGPGVGTQIMAGGANMIPALLQSGILKGGGSSGGNLDANYANYSRSGAITSPGQV